ncbi:hypothetical protein N9L68_03140 [bacterium]|nr:hypothetical protein [bacterium]
MGHGVEVVRGDELMCAATHNSLVKGLCDERRLRWSSLIPTSARPWPSHTLAGGAQGRRRWRSLLQDALSFNAMSRGTL